MTVSFSAACSVAAVLAFALPAHFLRNRYRLTFPAAYTTAGELARFLAETGEAPEVTVPWVEEGVWLALRGILAAAVGELPSTITRETDLTAALGRRSPPESLPGCAQPDPGQSAGA